MSLIKSNASFSVVRKEHCTKFVESLMQSLIHEDNLDIMFICEKSVMVKAHKMVIVSVSRFLKKLILAEKDTVYISLPGVDDRQLKLLIHFIYKGVGKVSEEELTAVKDVMLLLDIHLPGAEILMSCNLDSVNASGESVTETYNHHTPSNSVRATDITNRVLGKEPAVSRNSNGRVNAGIMELQNQEHGPINILPPLVNTGNLTFIQNENIFPFLLPYPLLHVKEEMVENYNEFAESEVNNEVASIINNDNEAGQEYSSNSIETAESATTPREEQVADWVSDEGIIASGERTEESIVSGDTETENMTVDDLQTEDPTFTDNKKTEDISTNDSTILENSFNPDSEYEKFSHSNDIELNELTASLHYDITQNKFVPEIVEINSLKDQIEEPTSVLTIEQSCVNENDANVTEIRNNTKKVGRPSIFSEEQTNILEQAYKDNKKPTSETVKDLSTRLEMPEKCICNWFAYSRNKEKYKRIKKNGKLMGGRLSTFSKEQRNILEQTYKENEKLTTEADKNFSTMLKAPENCIIANKRQRMIANKRRRMIANKRRRMEDQSSNRNNSEKHVELGSILFERKKMILDKALETSKSQNEHSTKKFFEPLQEPENEIKDCITTTCKTETIGIKENAKSKFGRPSIFSEEQKYILEQTYEENEKPTNETINDLSAKIEMPAKSIKHWFDYKRKKYKKSRERSHIFSEKQESILEAVYESDKCPEENSQKKLAQELSVEEQNIHNQFLNRQQKNNVANTEFNNSTKDVVNNNFKVENSPMPDETMTPSFDTDNTSILADAVDEDNKNDVTTVSNVTLTANTEFNNSTKEMVNNNFKVENAPMPDETMTPSFDTDNTSILADAVDEDNKNDVTTVSNVTLTDKSSLGISEKIKIGKGICKIVANISCGNCKKKFISDRSLKVHDCYGYRQFKCQFCDASFDRQRKCEAHMKVHMGIKSMKVHMGIKSYKFSKYGRTYNWRHNLNVYKRSCKDLNKKYKEDNINIGHVGHVLIFNKKQSIVLEKAFKINIFPDKQCIEKLSQQLQKPENQVKNWFSNRRKKERLGMSSMSSPSVTRIKSEYSSNKNKISIRVPHVSCKICGKRFLTHRSMKAHDCRKYNSYKCQHCDASYNNPERLENHVRAHTGIKPFLCNECNCSFSCKHNLDVHFRRCKGRPPLKSTSEENIKNIQQSEKRGVCKIVANMSCKICKKRFISKSSLKVHNCWMYKKYKCDFCDASFDLRQKYEAHIRVHLGVRPYKCCKCHRSFVQKHQLFAHERCCGDLVKLKIEKPFKCHLCTVQFSSKGTLNRHLRNFH